jgi:hypothetical protein
VNPDAVKPDGVTPDGVPPDVVTPPAGHPSDATDLLDLPDAADPLRAVRRLERRIRDRLDQLGTAGTVVQQARRQVEELMDRARREAADDSRRVGAHVASNADAVAVDVARRWTDRIAALQAISDRRRADDVSDVLASVVPQAPVRPC